MSFDRSRGATWECCNVYPSLLSRTETGCIMHDLVIYKMANLYISVARFLKVKIFFTYSYGNMILREFQKLIKLKDNK